MRIRLLALSVFVGVALIVSSPMLVADAPEARHVVMISIDGLMPSTYTQPGPSKVPTLRRLMQEGVYAVGVVGVLPTVTYPSHTSMITGVPPAIHGIYNNYVLDPEDHTDHAWYWYGRDVQVATLPGAVGSRGLSTAAVSWPATVGSDIDFLMPEYGRRFYPETLDLLRALSHPRGLLDTYEASRGEPLPGPLTDADRTGLAAWIFRTYRPHLTLLHIFETDSAQHQEGPGSPKALAALEQADSHVKMMRDAITDAGLRDRTDIVIVSDHGFAAIEQQLHPNTIFKQEGLLEVDDSGNISRWDAYVQGAGGVGFVFLQSPEDASMRARVEQILTKLAANPANGILHVWDEADLRERGGDPRASFALDMKTGFYAGSDHEALLTDLENTGGHGFDPTRKELHASLIMSGPDVPKSGSLGVVRMTQIAPTIATWFDVGLSARADEPLALKPAGASR
jgi:hypothetical protein